MSQPLDHGVDLLLLLVHESLFEGSLRRQSQFSEQVILPPSVLVSHIIQNTDSLLLLEWEIRLDLLGHGKTGEHSFLSRLIDVLIMMCIS